MSKLKIFINSLYGTTLFTVAIYGFVCVDNIKFKSDLKIIVEK